MSKLRKNFPISWLLILLIAACLVFSEMPSFAAKSIADTIDNAISYIQKGQNPDGGWPLIPGGKSQIDTTALAVQSLILADEEGSSKQIKSGIDYLLENQGKEGGWNNSPVDTALALIPLSEKRYVSADVRMKALKWLAEAQNGDGSWSNIAGKNGLIVATSKVLVGLIRLGFDELYTPFKGAMDWITDHRNYDGGWSETLGYSSNTLVTSWVLHALAFSYDIDEPMAWLKRAQNSDYGFGMTQRKQSSDPELTAYAIMALVAGEDPLYADRKAIRYLKKSQNPDGSYVSDIPSELDKPKSNLQTTCYAIWAIYARKIHKAMAQ